MSLVEIKEVANKNTKKKLLEEQLSVLVLLEFWQLPLPVQR